MQAAIEFAPWVIFFLVYKLGGGVYPATASLMVCMALLLAYDWLRERRVPKMHLILAILVWVFGTVTLILHDVRFLQWKASVFYWLLGLAFVVTAFVGKQPLLQQLLAKALPEGFTLPASTWRNNSVLMGGFYIVLGVANIWVALHRTEAEWVTFKVWILPPIAIVFSLALLFWMLRDAFGKEEAP